MIKKQILSARAQAATILKDIFLKKESLSARLHIISTDKSFVQELCYGVMRWYEALNFILKELLAKPLKEKDTDIYALLLLGLYQLIYLNTPEHAALNETVQAAKELNKPWATKLINGVLRNFIRKQKEISASVSKDLTAQYSHPKWLLELIQQAWPEQWKQILLANNERPPLILRINQQQSSLQAYLQLLKNENIDAETISNAKNSVFIKNPVDVKQLPGFTDGMFSVQDAAAQLAAELLDLQPKQRVLDACAAPGGKTTHIVEIEPKLEKLIAIDNDDLRIKKITENLQRLKLIGTQVLCGDAAKPKDWWDGQLFDRILLDAPCSATGVIRRHPDIKFLRRATDIKKLAAVQLDLLEKLWPLLKPTGILLYATCSILPQENVQVLEKFLKNHPDAKEKPIQADWGHPMLIGRQILTGEDNMDGFYYARLEKY